MRRKRLSKIAAVSLAFSLCVGTLAGCGKKEDEKSSDDLYNVMQDAQELKTGTFEMTVGMEAPEDDEKMELILSGVTTDESFDIEVSVDIDIDGMAMNGTVTRMVYEEEHLYVNLADAMEFVNSMEEVGELSDFGIDSDYIDIYVGDLYEQTDNTAAGEMAELMLEMLEDAATETDKEEGAAEDGSIEFKDTEVVAFMGNFAQSLKDNAEDLVDLFIESSNVSYDYDEVFDYYEDFFSEYGVDVDTLKEELDATQEMEITDEQKEIMVEEIETACDELITVCEDDEDADAKGSKFLMEASLDGKKGSRTYEMNVDFLAASESEGDEVRIYMNYVFEEGEEKVEAPEDSMELEALMEVLAPLLEATGTMDPEIGFDEPATGESVEIENADGSYALGCSWDDCEYTGRMDYIAPAGFSINKEASDMGFHAYNDEEWNSLYLAVYDGENYLNNYDYESISQNSEAPKGTISTPVGEMEYLIDNTEDWYTIYGFITIDAGHYLVMDYTVYDVDESTEAKLVELLTNFAQGLKVAR
ncbi:MAG: hypothetical protein IJA10_13445 [Lachnospiraceae bacterium]|nr:hypothetical protein [Lachnospiraceae bacterium]